MHIYKKATFPIYIYVFIFHLLYFIYLYNTDIVRPQYIMVYLFLVAFLNIKKVTNHIEYFLLFSVLAISSVVCLIFKGGGITDFYSIMYFFSLFILVLFYAVYRFDHYFNGFILFAYFGVIIFNLTQGINPNYILDNRSQNMVGFYMMCYTITYYVESYKANELDSKYNLIPAILNSIIALLMFGRSSIVVSILLLFCVIYENIRKNKMYKNVLYFLIFLFVLLWIYFQFQGAIDSFIVLSFSRFGVEGTDLTGRSEIWETYFFYIKDNLLYLLFGVPLEIDKVFVYVDRNLHNSYLTLHSYLGFGSLLVIAYIVRCFLKKRKFFLKSLLLVLLMRAFSDSILFFSYNDYVLFGLIFAISPIKKILI